VTVVGHKVFTVSIDASKSPTAFLDWRKYDMDNTSFRPYSLSPSLEALCVEYVRSLGLVFGCLDFAVSEDGDIFFFEINTSGQWYFLEKLVPDLGLLNAFVAMIVTASPDYD
jgi:hypothetical protein